jgi:hypothetical protein
MPNPTETTFVFAHRFPPQQQKSIPKYAIKEIYWQQTEKDPPPSTPAILLQILQHQYRYAVWSIAETRELNQLPGTLAPASGSDSDPVGYHVADPGCLSRIPDPAIFCIPDPAESYKKRGQNKL